MVDASDCPMGFAMATAFKPSLDKSSESFNTQGEKGSKGGRPKKSDDGEIKKLIVNKPTITAQEIADSLGVSVSAVQKHTIWKNRKIIILFLFYFC